MTLTEVHGRLADTTIYFTIAMALWGLYRYFRRQGIDSSFWGGLAIGEVLYLVQGALGAYLFFSGLGTLEGGYIHILYGVSSLLVIPAIFVFTRGDEERRVMLIYGVGLLFLVGILIRGKLTGG